MDELEFNQNIAAGTFRGIAKVGSRLEWRALNRKSHEPSGTVQYGPTVLRIDEPSRPGGPYIVHLDPTELPDRVVGVGVQFYAQPLYEVGHD